MSKKHKNRNKIEVIQEKIEKNENLTPDEEKEVMSTIGQETPVETDETAFDDAEDVTQEEDKPAESEAENIEKTSGEDEEKPKSVETETTEAAQEEQEKVEEEEEQPAPEAEKVVSVGDLEKIRQEVEKEDGKEQLEGFTDREKAYFWEMRRERRRAQKAEQELDQYRLDALRRKAEEDARKKKAEEDEDPLPDLQEDDFATKADLKKLLNRVAPKVSRSANEEILTAKYMQVCDKEAAGKYDDYPVVMECAEEIIYKNPAYQQKLRDAMAQGDNPAIVMYHLAKGDPEFAAILPVAQAKLAARGALKTPVVDQAKLEEAKKVQERIVANQQKAKTSGHHSGGDNVVQEHEEYTAERLANMSDKEFQAIPRAKRDKLLRRFGA